MAASDIHGAVYRYLVDASLTKAAKAFSKGVVKVRVCEECVLWCACVWTSRGTVGWLAGWLACVVRWALCVCGVHCVCVWCGVHRVWAGAAVLCHPCGGPNRCEAGWHCSGRLGGSVRGAVSVVAAG